MTKAGKTIYYFGYWVLLSGLALLFFPSYLLNFVGLRGADDIVARLLGMVVLFLSYYYFRTGRDDKFKEFYRWTTHARFSAFIIVSLFVLVGAMPIIVIAFVFVDLLGAIWTWHTLRFS